MKKLILLALIATSSLLSRQHIVHVYKDIPQTVNTDSAVLQIVAICSAWCAKYTKYYFDRFDIHDTVIFKSHNYQCAFWMRFNRTTRECRIEFNAEDDSFDYPSFKKLMDSVFLGS